MADISLKDRLLEHAKSFDGLLSLIPAKYYYGTDNSDQWKKKKQTKEQAAAAQRAKLDPKSVKSAKDVMDERARKRKLHELSGLESEVCDDIESVQKELPREGLSRKNSKSLKKQRISTDKQHSRISVGNPESVEKIDKCDLKQKRNREKQIEASKRKNEKLLGRSISMNKLEEKEVSIRSNIIVPNDVAISQNDELSKPSNNHPFSSKKDSSSSVVSKSPSPLLDTPTEPSSNTSISSTVPPTQAPKHIKIPADPELLRSRLAAKIEALRAARKADGPDGRPARNRHELLEARRKKEEQRRAHKKQIRLKAKAEEEARRTAAIISARNSPTSKPMSPAVNLDQNLSFSRICFMDGQQLKDDLSGLRNIPKKYGPQDIATSLIVNEKRQQMLAALDDKRRSEIEEKDLWLNAKKRIHREKLRDNVTLLRKSLKRKENAKKKSENEWNERLEGVAKGQAMRQKKREENLMQRRISKASNGKNRGARSNSVKSKKSKVKSRPGFEGSFSSRKKN